MSLLKCPKCGEMFSDSYKTCPFCEEDEAFANGGKKPVNPGRRVHRQKSPSILGPTLVLVLVLVAGVLLYTLIGSGKPGDDRPDPPKNPTEDVDPNTPAVTLSLDQTALELTVGGTGKLTATGAEGITWTSSNADVAAVGEDGTVTAVAAGTATISASAEGADPVTCTVTVKEAAADQEQFYILVEFAAPEGTVLPEPDQVEEGFNRAVLWGGPDGRGIGFGAYRDESCTSFIGSSEAGYAIDYVEDSDPTDNKMEFIIRGHIDPMPKDAAYCLFSGIQSLCMQYQGEWVTMLDGMDIDLIVPLVGMGTHYDFQGRCGVNLNGVTLAVAENLTISPISVSMDLVIPDGAAYDAAFGQDGPWQMYVLMSDGSKIQTRFEKVGGVQDVFHDDAGRTFFRADHVRFELESPIDVAEIQNLVFTGDNSRIYEGEDRTGTLIQFDFGPWHFQNETYWNEVNYYWRKD